MAIQRVDNIGLAVRDVAGIAAFFGDMLGLPTKVDLNGQPPSARVDVGAQYLYVFQTESDVPGQNRGAGLTGNPRGLDHISFTVDDVDQTYVELRDRGVDFDGQPETVAAWGIRLVGFRDPEGNYYYLVRTLTDSGGDQAS